MDKYRAWIGALTPLNFANEKSLEQILYELIPIILEIKEKQDTYPNLFKDFLTELTNKINEIKNNLTTYNTSFDEKRNSIKQNVTNKESEITSNILAKFTEMLNKISEFGSGYFERHPDVFDKGINEVNFDLTNQDSCYYKTNKDNELFGSINLTGVYSSYSSQHGYWMNTTDSQLYYDNTISNSGKINTIIKYKNRLFKKIPYFEYEDILFPETENGYFIGFYDLNHGCFFAKTISDNVTTYALKVIDLTTKEMTTYTDLVMPSDFTGVFLTNNSHYIIKKYNETYFLLYTTSSGNVINICKSNDLIHWGRVGSLPISQQASLRVINNDLYIVCLSYTYIYNETDNSFSEVKYNNKSISMCGYFKNNYLFYEGYNLRWSQNKDLSNASSGTTNRFTTLNFSIISDKYACTNNCLLEAFTTNYFISGDDNTHTFLNVLYSSMLTRYNILYNYFYDIGKMEVQYRCNYPLNLDNNVLNENNDLYLDKTLQKVIVKTKWVEI